MTDYQLLIFLIRGKYRKLTINKKAAPTSSTAFLFYHLPIITKEYRLS